MEHRTPIHRTYSDDMFNQLLNGAGKKLNIGCGQDCLNDWINLDRNPGVKPDVVAELDGCGLPFVSDYFDHILASHILEHIYDIVQLKSEIKRVLKKNGTFTFMVPYYLSPDAWGCDSHVRAFSMHMFIEENWTGWERKDGKLLTFKSRDNEQLQWIYGKFVKV
jgi:SAM-dependent methyltransferase